MMLYKKYNLWLVVYATICFIMINNTMANIYYVSTSGNDNNNGTNVASAWRTIQHAADNVVAGDMVYIEAGNYEHENIVFSTSGTATAKIIFAGYTNTPGDNPIVNYQLGTTLDSTIMPLLDGGNRSTAGSAITLTDHDYIILKNIQIKNYNIGVYGYSIEHCSIENIIAIELGNPTASYDGHGIVIGSYGNNNNIENCTILNACAEGISVTGNTNTINNCKVYCDDASSVKAAMDYYIVIRGDNNKITDCYVKRIGDLPHGGHGIQLKGYAENNCIKDCIAVNQSCCFGVRHRGIKNNIFDNCLAIKTNTNDSWSIGGFIIRDGASHNTFKNCRTIKVDYAIEMYDTAEDEGAQTAGSYNTFENCIFENSNSSCISFFYYDRESAAFNNTFINCTFDGGNYLFESDRSNYGNKMINCIITNISNLVNTSDPYWLNVEYSYSDFYNNGFSIPSGDGNFSANPLFKNAGAGDYRLKTNSPCINAGTNSDTIDNDFNYLTRNDGNIDVGATEFKIEPLIFLKFSKNSGTTISDSMDNIPIGKQYGASWVEGLSGHCLKFDGINDYVDLGNPSALNISGSRTISAWIKLDNLNGYNTIVAKYLWGYSFFVSNGYLCAYIAGSSGSAYSISNDILSAEEWHYVAMTFDNVGDREIHLYIDGAEISSYSRQDALTGHPINSSAIFSIGSDSGNRYFFNGLIDEVKIFNKVQNSNKILDDFKNISVILQCNLDNNLSDQSANIADGYCYGASWVKGLSGRCLNFDGINDYVDFGNPSALNISGSRTISAWIKLDNLNGYNTIVAKYLWGYSFFVSNGYLCAYIAGSSTSAYSISNDILSAEEWHYIAMTFDNVGDREIHLYIDGAEISSYSRQDILTGHPINSSAIFSIGSDSGNRYFFNGLIDEVKIFNKNLSLKRLNDLYQTEQ